MGGDVEYRALRVPAGTVLDGAVVELAAPPDRTIVDAQVRIPAPQPERM
jgi:hypothetical protein